MAEEELEETDSDVVDDVDDGGNNAKGKKVGLGLSSVGGGGIARILLSSLQYIGVAVLTFMISYCVSRSNTMKVGQTGANSPENLISTDVKTDDFYNPIPSGFDWTMDEFIINTADKDANHFVKTKIVVSYDKDKPLILTGLTIRSSQIHAEVRKIIGSKKYSQIQGVDKQDLLSKEIKTKIQLVIGQPGIIDVFLREFTLH